MLKNILILLVLLLSLAGCGESIDFTNKTPEKVGEEVKKLDSRIEQVRVESAPNSKAFIITITYLATPSPSALLMEGPHIKDILKNIVTAKGNADVGAIVVAINESGVDKLGNKGAVSSVKLGWDMALLRKTNWQNITEYMIIDASQLLDIGPFGNNTLNAYCKDGASSYGEVFCKKIGY